jgi:peptidoglycan/LPS O-acetylase OafA/YrhL
MTEPVAPAERNLPRLTSLRAFAAFGVLVFHLQFWTGWSVTEVLGVDGSAGVAFFFILSGFVLTWSMRPGTSAWAFYRRRFARVYPNHFVTAVAALVVPVTVLAIEGQALVLNFALIHTWVPRNDWVYSLNGVSWSLACEAFFYASFPVLLFVMRRLPTRQVLAASSAWVLGTMLITLFGASQGGRTALLVDVNPLLRSGEFVLGIATALLMSRGWRPQWSLTGSCLTLIVALTVTRFLDLPYPAANALLILPLWAVLAAAASSDLKKLPGWLPNRIFVYLGELSFAFYLVHELVIINTLHVFGWRNPVPDMQELGLMQGAGFAVVAILFATFLAAVLHHVVELPCQRALLAR